MLANRPPFIQTGSEGDEWRLGKGYLVSRLQVLLQNHRLRLPRTAEATVLAQELLDYEIRVDPDGDAKFGAFKVGKHDDLVTALGLAVLRDEVVYDGPTVINYKTGKAVTG